MKPLGAAFTGLGAVVVLWTGLLQPSMAERGQERGSVWPDQDATMDRVDAHIRRALACYENGNLDCALVELDRARALRPQDPQIRFMLGNAYYRKRNWRSAIAQYQEAFRLRPDHPDTYLNLGFSYYHAGQVAKAVPAWEIAVKLSPHDPLARMALAIGLSGVGRLEDALSHFSLALELRPDSCERSQLAMDIRWAGDALAQIGRLCRLIEDQGR